MSDNQSIDLRDYLRILVRQRVVFFVTAGIILAVSLAMTILWPPTYRSTATVLIEEQDIPADLVRSVITSSAVQRIQTISQRVMTRSNLLRIVEKFDMYSEARKQNKLENILTGMRKAIRIETVDVEVVDPKSGRPGLVAIAFTVSFTHRDPTITQQVTEELAAVFLAQNEASRSSSAEETLRFLTAEAEVLSEQIAGLESNLAAFKQQNHMSLPELAELNLRLMDHVERQQATVESQIRSLQERRYSLESDLAKISPWNPMVTGSGERVVDPVSMLRTLRSQYISATAKFSDIHPDVIRLKREIESLEQVVGAADGASKPAANVEPDNPAYITLNAQLKAVKSELWSLRTLSSQLNEKQLDYAQRFSEAPSLERDYLTLSREYDSAVSRYSKIKESQIEARVRLDLEERNAEKFSLIDPSRVPEQPIKPNRTLLAMFGFLFALTGGVVAAAIAEARVKQPQQTEVARLADAELTIKELRRQVAVFNRDTEKLGHLSQVSGRHDPR